MSTTVQIGDLQYLGGQNRLAFDSMFREGEKKANQRATYDSEVQDALRRYHGRAVVLKVTDDATYMFTIYSNGVVYTFSPQSHTVDMHAEMDKQTFERLIRGEISPIEVLGMIFSRRIKSQNIGPAEINLIRKLLGR